MSEQHGAVKGSAAGASRGLGEGSGPLDSLRCGQTEHISSVPSSMPEHSLLECGQYKKDFCSH